MDVFLVIAEEAEPIGWNDRSLVAARFGKYVTNHERPVRELDSLRMTFDRLKNVKKPTGDPSYPRRVRRAKHIARDILSKVQSVWVGDTLEDSEEVLHGDDDEWIASQSTGAVDRSSAARGRTRKRKAGATGVRRGDGAEELVEHVGAMSPEIC